MMPRKKFSLLFVSDAVILILLFIYNYTNIFAVEGKYPLQNITSSNGSGGIQLYVTFYTRPFSLFLFLAFVVLYIVTFVYAYNYIKK